MMTARKKAFKGLGHFVNDMVISLCCAQTLITPLPVMQRTQGRKTFFLKKVKRQDFLFSTSCGGALRQDESLSAAASPFKLDFASKGHPLSTCWLWMDRSDVFCLWMQVGPPPPQV